MSVVLERTTNFRWKMASKLPKIAPEIVINRRQTPLIVWLRDKLNAVYRDRTTPPPGLPTPDGEVSWLHSCYMTLIAAIHDFNTTSRDCVLCPGFGKEHVKIYFFPWLLCEITVIKSLPIAVQILWDESFSQHTGSAKSPCCIITRRCTSQIIR